MLPESMEHHISTLLGVVVHEHCVFSAVLITAFITTDFVFSSATRLVYVSKAEVALCLLAQLSLPPPLSLKIHHEALGGLEGCFFFTLPSIFTELLPTLWQS